MSDYLFECGRDALYFAFRYCDQQHAKAPPLVKGRVLGSGKGLIGLDGAAQAGFIHREVMQLGKLAEYLLTARFCDQNTQCHSCGSTAKTSQWIGACRWLGEEMRKAIAPEAHVRLMDALVQRHFSMHKMTLAMIASSYGDGEDKIKKLNAKLVPHLKKLESLAQQKIEDRLLEIGIVCREDEQVA